MTEIGTSRASKMRRRVVARRPIDAPIHRAPVGADTPRARRQWPRRPVPHRAAV